MLGALAGSAHVNLSVNRGTFSRDMHAAERDFVRSVGRIDAESRRAGVQFARGLGAAVIGTVGPLYLLGRAVHASWDELVAMRREAAQTEAVIASTGGVANVTAEDIDRLSEAGLRLAGVDDQIVQRGLNVLLTFRGVRNEVGENNDVFDQAVEALLDMGIALQRSGTGVDDLQAHAIRLGRALQDPVRGLTALRRVGVQFTEEEELMVKRLVEAGDVIGAQKIILAELRTEFGGSAAAAGQEFPAALARAREAGAELGAELLLTLTPAIMDLAEELEAWLVELRENEELQREFRDTIVGVAEVIVDLAKFANDVAQALGGWEDAIKVLIALKLAGVLLTWTRGMRAYSGATWGAVAATTALAIAQGGTVINPRGGVFPPTRGPGPHPGPIGRGLGRLGPWAGRVLPGAGSVAIGSAIILSQTPGAGGERTDVDRYPLVRDLVNRVAGGGVLDEEEAAALALLDPKKPLNQQDESRLRRAENKLRVHYQGPRRGGRATGPGGRPDEGTRARPGAEPKTREPLPVPRTELSLGAQQALAEADRTESDVDDMKALLRAERELEELLEQDDLTKKERLKITQDLARVENSIRSIEDRREADQQRAADEAKRAAEERKRAAEEARQDRHEQRVYELERRAALAEETHGIRDDLRTLLALQDYHRRWRDQQKRGSDEWRSAQDDLDAVNERIEAVREGERDRLQRVRRWKLDRRVRLAEETEGVADDIRAYQALRADLIRERQEHRKYSDEWMATQDEIDDVNARIAAAKKQKGTKQNLAGNFKRLEEELAFVLSEFAPNFMPGAGPSTGMRGRVPAIGEQHLHFTTAPTDWRKEQRYAFGAAQAAFDG